MAMQLNAGKIGRADLFSILTENIIVDHSLNGRKDGHGEEEVASLAQSILDHGQQQPVVVRRLPHDKTVQLVSGYGRHAAVAYINAHLSPPSPVLLSCRIVECNEEQAFLRNLVENIDRAETTPIDDAHNQRRLREVFGWAEDRIATFYKRSVSSLAASRRLLTLSPAIQKEVSEGTLPATAAVELTKVPEEVQQPIIDAARDTNGHVNGAEVKTRVRQARQESGEKTSSTRSMKEVKQFFADMTGPAESEKVRTLAKAILKYLAGESTDKQMENAVAKACS